MSLIDTFFGSHQHTTRRGTLLSRFDRAMALRRSRAQLASLEPHLLDDIGIDQATAEAEAARPVWDAPETWIR